MNWADEIDVAMKRGNSPYTAEDVLRWLGDGTAYFVAAEDCHASLWFHDGEAEVGHMYGNGMGQGFVYCVLKGYCAALNRGYDKITVRGRPGWKRFLQKRGLDYVCRW